MRVDRKFNFYGTIAAYIARRTLMESPLESVWVVTGKLCYLYKGQELPIESEPRGDDGGAMLDVGDESADAEEHGDAGAESASAIVKAPVQCTIVVRDTNGSVPMAHAGMFFSAQVVRRGLYAVVDRVFGEQCNVDSDIVDGADFRAHIYDVVRCKSVRCDSEIAQSTLINALAHTDPLVLLTAAKIARDSRAQLVASKIRDGSVAQNAARDATVRETKALKRDSTANTALLTQVYASSRTRLTTFYGLLNALPSLLQVPAAIAFAGFYQMHTGLYTATPALLPQISRMRLNGSDLRSISASEICLLTRLAQTDVDGAVLTLEHQLFFGALIGAVSLAEYKSALGQWPGIDGPDAFSFDDDQRISVAKVRHWHQYVGMILSLDDAASQRQIATAAWYLYRASHSFLQFNTGATVFTQADIVKACIDRARFTGNAKMLTLFNAPDAADCIRLAIDVLVQLDVWRGAPISTLARLFAGVDASTCAMYSTARVMDVSARLAYCAVHSDATFASCGTLRDEWYTHIVIDRTVVFYSGTPPSLTPPDCAVVAVPLHTPLLLERHTQDAFSEARILMQWAQKVVLIDAHLLDEIDLLRFFVMVGTETTSIPAPKVLLIVGDMRLHSPFAALALAARRAADGRRFFDFAHVASLKPLISSAPLCAPNQSEGASALPSVDGANLQMVLYRAAGNDRVATAAAAQLLERLHTSALADFVRSPGNRWLLVASNFKSASAAIDSLIDAIRVAPHGAIPKMRCRNVCDALVRLSKNPRLLTSTLLLASPFIGFRNRCVPVRAAYLMHQRSPMLDSRITGEDCQRIDPLSWDGGQTLSLDSDAVLLELETGQFGDDHQDCCRTWSPNIMRVANHRAEVCSQSLAMARDALPCDSRVHASAFTTALFFAADYTFDAVYSAAVRASYYPRRIDVYSAPGALAFAIGLQKHQGRPRTCLADLFASIAAASAST